MPDKLYHDFSLCALLFIFFFLFMYYTFHTHTLAHKHTRSCLRDAAPTTQKNLLRRRRRRGRQRQQQQWHRQRQRKRNVHVLLYALRSALPVCIVYGCPLNVRGVLAPRSLAHSLLSYYYYYMLVLFVLLRFTLSFGFYLFASAAIGACTCIFVCYFVALLLLPDLRESFSMRALTYYSYIYYVLSLALDSLKLRHALATLYFVHCCRLRAPVWRV